MQVFTNLKSFLATDLRSCRYKYKMSRTKLLDVLISNQLYHPFSKEVTLKIRAIHDVICQQLMIQSLDPQIWKKMQLQILKRVKTTQPDEKVNITVYFDLSDSYELEIEVITSIHHCDH